MDGFPVQTPAQLGALLRGHRRERGLSQAQLAHQLGLHQSTLSNAELHPERLGVDGLFRILSGLGLELVLRGRESVPRGDW